MGFLIRLAIAAGGLWLASRIVSGISIGSTGTLVLAALLLGVVNALVRPVLVLLTLPITIVTLGLFLLVINAAMLGLVALALPQLRIEGFVPALLGSLVVSAASWLGTRLAGRGG